MLKTFAAESKLSLTRTLAVLAVLAVVTGLTAALRRQGTAVPVAQAPPGSRSSAPVQRSEGAHAVLEVPAASTNHPEETPAESTYHPGEPQAQETAAQPAAPRPEARVPVLMYHEIAPGPNNLYVMPQELADHLEYLQQQGYTTIPLQHLYESFTKGRQLPSRPVVLTFDDGYLSFAVSALPILRGRRFTATLFVITGLVGKPGYITWEQARQIAGAGMEVGAHTVTHPDLARVDVERQRREVSESRRVLEAELGQPVRFFAYPAGRYNDKTLSAVKEAGFFGAVTTVYGPATPAQDPLQWQRIRINQGVSKEALGALLRAAEGR